MTIKKICNRLDLDNSIIKTSISIFENIYTNLLIDNFDYKVLAASLILFTVKLFGIQKPDIIEISKLCNINNEKVMKKIYKKLFQIRESIVPCDLLNLISNLDLLV